MEFETLPVEVQIHVFEKLDLRSLLVISELNRYFHNVANTTEIWKYQCQMRGWEHGVANDEWKSLLQEKIKELRLYQNVRPFGVLDLLESCLKKKQLIDSPRKSGTYFWQPLSIEDANTSTKQLESRGD